MGKKGKQKKVKEEEVYVDPDLFVVGPDRTADQDYEEQTIRDEVLARNVRIFRKFERQRLIDELEQEEKAKWKQYLRCDGMPDPRSVPNINTYLQIWNEATEVFDANELKKRCAEALPLLEALDQILQKTTWFTEAQLKNYDEVRMGIRKALARTLEETSYYLMSDIEKRLTHENVCVATYELVANGLKMNVFTPVALPVKIDVEDPKPLDLSFPILHLTARLPVSILAAGPICMRAVLFMVDLFSEYTSTFYRPAIADEMKDLYTLSLDEYTIVMLKRSEQEKIVKKFLKDTKIRIKELEKMIEDNKYAKLKEEHEELERLLVTDAPPMIHPWIYAYRQESNPFDKYLADCKPVLLPYEVSLRKYSIVGGVFYMDVYQQPPQPKKVERGVTMTTIQLPRSLRRVDYTHVYQPPPPLPPPDPENPRDPEEIEAEMRKIEAEYEKLILVNIDLSHDIFWTEPPIICQWSEDDKIWSTEFIYDYKYNEDKYIVTFRTGILWPVGIALPKYTNLPFQSFEIKPDSDPESNAVVLSVTGIYVSITFLVRLKTVKITSVYGPNGEAAGLEKYLNKAFNVDRIVPIMKSVGLDLFPTFDAHNVLDGTCAKVWPLEMHFYQCIALVSTAYEFRWSRWNVAAGRRSIVVQGREAIDRKREANFQLYLISPFCATILACSENSPEYDETPLAGIKFFPDFLALNNGIGSSAARRAVAPRKPLATLLSKLKLFSFS